MFVFFKGNHKLAVIKRQESYDLLKQACSDLFKSVNKIIDSKVKVDGKDIMVDMYLGGDYKVSLFTIHMF